MGHKIWVVVSESTEMTSNKEILPTPDPVAFAGALLAPLLVALLFFWAALIPVFFGAVPNLVFGTPVLLWMVPVLGQAVPQAKGRSFFSWAAFCVTGWTLRKSGQDRRPIRHDRRAANGRPAWCRI